MSARPSTTPSRWQWYHFYFLLALFDVVVIFASLALHHRTLDAYEVSLAALSDVAARQTWIGDLRLAVMALNAPGNDIFESRRVDVERARAAEAQAILEVSMRRETEYGIGLDALRTCIAGLIAAQDRVFEEFSDIATREFDDPVAQPNVVRASIAMAEMDRQTAAANELLTRIGWQLRGERDRLHRAHRTTLERHTAWERYFVAVVVVILAGVLWYGRTLQETHVRMKAGEARIEEERQTRMAAIGELCTSVAHGIRNPLAAMTSSTQLALEYGTIDDTTRGRLQDVLRSADRLVQRSTRLLQFAQGPAGDLSTYDVVTEIRQTVHDCSPLLEARGLTLTTTLPETPILLFGDADRLHQAIGELLTNAMDHTPAGGTIEVAASCADALVTIDVIDDGPGIPPHLRDQVFTLFFTTRPEGNGIGLAAVRRAVELHNGSVSIVPTNRGTHMRMVLPAPSL